MEKKEKPVRTPVEEFVNQIEVCFEVEEDEKKFEKYYQYVKPNLKVISTMLSEGYTEKDVYTMLGLSKSSWYKYKSSFEELREIVMYGRIRLISDIETSMFDSALGKKRIRKVKTKETYNPETGEFIPEQREVIEEDLPMSEKMAQYVLRRLSKGWNVTEEPEDNETKKVIESIGSLIDKIGGSQVKETRIKLEEEADDNNLTEEEGVVNLDNNEKQ